ncbi:MAG TPA: isoaspartyl peptidase/L-asparaginase [Sphingobacteriaceae bacterium]|nr:isoaspartyl peptidase/L-asparaginase [Sphingobacteriaceae bacterium]
MKKIFIFSAMLFTSIALVSCNDAEQSAATDSEQSGPKYVMVIHGGAGTISQSSMTPEREQAYHEGLTTALENGYQAISEGKSALDAVEAAILVLEDNPLFNAGKGAVFTHEGKNELDASIMDGRDRNAGAVAGLTRIKNPILAARMVMEESEHVMMVGHGAELFVTSLGMDTVEPSYFFTERRWDALQRAIKAEEVDKAAFNQQEYDQHPDDRKFGTVGAVALDQNGNLAAGTSTGGMTNKRYGRVGDAPIIGAGTYANNETVGVSSTGWGEYYIRSVAAYRVSALMELKGLSVVEASKQVIQEIEDLGGNGGLISLDKNGQVAMEFNTSGMYRGTVDEDGNISIHIFKD